jgi:hypothetical protein
MSRRTFLLAAGGAAALAGSPASAPAAAPEALPAGALAAFGALVTALRAAPDGRFGLLDPVRAVEDLVRRHAEQPAATRRHVAAVLGALHRDGVPGYAELARPRRPATAAGAERAAVVAAAVALAAELAEPDGDDGRIPVLLQR